MSTTDASMRSRFGRSSGLGVIARERSAAIASTVSSIARSRASRRAAPPAIRVRTRPASAMRRSSSPSFSCSRASRRGLGFGDRLDQSDQLAPRGARGDSAQRRPASAVARGCPSTPERCVLPLVQSLQPRPSSVAPLVGGIAADPGRFICQGARMGELGGWRTWWVKRRWYERNRRPAPALADQPPHGPRAAPSSATRSRARCSRRSTRAG